MDIDKHSDLRNNTRMSHDIESIADTANNNSDLAASPQKKRSNIWRLVFLLSIILTAGYFTFNYWQQQRELEAR